MSTLNKALEIASSAHAGAIDKMGKPYFLHPLRVMMQMPDDLHRIVAVLHDVIEDCPEWSYDRLRQEGFQEDIIVALDCLTWRKAEGETYDDYVNRAASNPIARCVKFADLEDNMDLRRLNQLTEKEINRISRYHRAYRFLQQHRDQTADGNGSLS